MFVFNDQKVSIYLYGEAFFFLFAFSQTDSPSAGRWMCLQIPWADDSLSLLLNTNTFLRLVAGGIHTLVKTVTLGYYVIINSQMLFRAISFNMFHQLNRILKHIKRKCFFRFAEFEMKCLRKQRWGNPWKNITQYVYNWRIVEQ